MIVFDIETGPLSDERLLALAPPFDPEKAVPHPGEFDCDAVAIGNLKDAAKIAAKVDAARYNHQQLVGTLAARREAAQQSHLAKFAEKAALSAATGQVLAIGVTGDDGRDATWTVADEAFGRSGEAGVIEAFWSHWTANPSATFVGFNIFGFDLPFLIRRSWILGVAVPADVRQPSGRYYSPQFVDLLAVWGCGSREFISLHDVDKALGGAGKPEGVDGADFARLFGGSPEERAQALAYLANDLAMTRRVADAMQIL